MGMGGLLGHVAKMLQTNFRHPTQESTTLNLALIGQGVSEKKMYKHCGRTMDGRMLTDRRWTIGIL